MVEEEGVGLSDTVREDDAVGVTEAVRDELGVLVQLGVRVEVEDSDDDSVCESVDAGLGDMV